MLASPAPIDIHSFEEFSHQYAGQGEQAYLLNVDGQLFLRVYVMPDTYTLAWNGVIDFSKLTGQILYALPRTMHGPGNGSVHTPPAFLPKTIRYLIKATTVSLIISGQVETYSLVNPLEYRAYKKILRDKSADIRFARFDIRNRALRRDRMFEYTFTASNPDVLGSEASELTILMPKPQTWSSNLIGWILKHHNLYISS